MSHRRPRKKLSHRKRRRVTEQQRLERLNRLIYDASLRGKPLTPKQIAHFQRLSLRTTKRYIRLLKERVEKEARRRGRHVSLQEIRKGKRVTYMYVEEREPERPKQFTPQRGDVVVRLYLDYESPHDSSSNIEIQCVAVAPHDPAIPLMQDLAILAPIERLRRLVAYNLRSNKIANMLNVGFMQPTALSHNENWYRHGSGGKVYF